MFSSVDKMLVSMIGAGLTLLVGAGYITADQATLLSTIVVTAIGAAVTGFVTWLVPNKA